MNYTYFKEISPNPVLQIEQPLARLNILRTTFEHKAFALVSLNTAKPQL